MGRPQRWPPSWLVQGWQTTLLRPLYQHPGPPYRGLSLTITTMAANNSIETVALPHAWCSIVKCTVVIMPNFSSQAASWVVVMTDTCHQSRQNWHYDSSWFSVICRYSLEIR